MTKPPPLKFNMRSLSTNGMEGRNQLIEAIRKTEGKYSLTQKSVWNPNNFFPKLLGSTDPMISDPYDDSRKLKTLDRNFDTMPWYHNRTTPDNLFGETIAHDHKKSKILKKKLRQLRKSSQHESGSLLPSMRNAKQRNILQSGSISNSRILNVSSH